MPKGAGFVGPSVITFRLPFSLSRQEGRVVCPPSSCTCMNYLDPRLSMQSGAYLLHGVHEDEEAAADGIEGRQGGHAVRQADHQHYAQGGGAGGRERGEKQAGKALGGLADQAVAHLRRRPGDGPIRRGLGERRAPRLGRFARAIAQGGREGRASGGARGAGIHGFERGVTLVAPLQGQEGRQTRTRMSTGILVDRQARSVRPVGGAHGSLPTTTTITIISLIIYTVSSLGSVGSGVRTLEELWLVSGSSGWTRRRQRASSGGSPVQASSVCCMARQSSWRCNTWSREGRVNSSTRCAMDSCHRQEKT